MMDLGGCCWLNAQSCAVQSCESGAEEGNAFQWSRSVSPWFCALFPLEMQSPEHSAGCLNHLSTQQVQDIPHPTPFSPGGEEPLCNVGHHFVSGHGIKVVLWSSLQIFGVVELGCCCRVAAMLSIPQCFGREESRCAALKI